MLINVIKQVHQQLTSMFCVIVILCAIQDKIIQLCSCKMQQVNSLKDSKGLAQGTICTQFSVGGKGRKRWIYLVFHLIFQTQAERGIEAEKIIRASSLQEVSPPTVALQASNAVVTLPLLVISHGFFTEFARPQDQSLLGVVCLNLSSTTKSSVLTKYVLLA